MDNLLASRSFVLWIKGECSQEEQEYWDEWLKKDPDRKTMVIEAREIIQAVGNEYEASKPRKELEKLNELIDQYEYRNLQSDRVNHHKMYRRSRGPIAAVVILFVVVIGTVVAYQDFPPGEEKTAEQVPKSIPQEYSTNYGEKLTFRLSDGSNIILNANSELTFSSKVEKGLNTEVWLRGEAFFDITRLEGDQQRTFTVHTKNGSIQVLGTRFTVNTFREQTQAVLEEGKIQVEVRDESADQSPNYFIATRRDGTV
ncbi:MAG: FecR family protein [Balneolaceae bacterium]|nr:FecR family protein [Balneolaceae bacterium]